MDRNKYLETEEQRSIRFNSNCLVFHGDKKCPSCNQPDSSKREDINYEPKGISSPESGSFPLQEFEFKLAAHLRSVLKLD
jgi:hypothetical protein